MEIKSKSLIMAFIVVLIYASIKKNTGLEIDCPINYLNPFQHFLSCNAFSLIIYSILFLVAFVSTFYLLKLLEKSLK